MSAAPTGRPDRGMTDGAKAMGKIVPPWFWIAVMVPVLITAGGFWFFTGTESGRMLRLDCRYGRLWGPERLPVSARPSSEGPPGYGMVVRLRKDGRFLLGDEVVDATKLERESAIHGARSLDADGRSQLAVNIVSDRRCRASHLIRVIEAVRRGFRSGRDA